MEPPPAPPLLHILVADDDETLRNLLRNFLTTRGYQVSVAVDGLQALDVFRQPDQKIEILLLDVEMPGLNGLETWKQIDTLKPGIPVVFWSADIDSYRSTLPTGGHVAALQKPCPLRELLQELEDRRAGSRNEV